ncbi:MAG TPA: amino acid adenylation domain-containing protein, partial [Thermoanaerobaculia bacterium]|nr:amino acid adenylation domain-containing protein [Thermoanaerobaculia bacterium]
MSKCLLPEVQESKLPGGARHADDRGSAAAWWRARLAGLPAALELPGDRPRPRVASGRRGRLALPLATSGWLGRLDVVAGRPAREAASALLLAGVAAFCARLTGRRELALGAPAPGTGGGDGLMVLGLRLAPDATFSEVLDRVQRLLRETADRGPVPPELLSEGEPSRHPLVQVAAAVRMPGEPLAPAPLRCAAGVPPLDLVWVLDRTVQPPALVLDYSADLWERAPRALVEGVDALLEAAVADPGLRLGALPLVPPAGRSALLGELAVVRTEYPRDAGIAELFAGEAAARPDAVAVVAGERCLSYGELARRSALLARRLRALGVGRSTPVAVALGHSLELIEAMLAIVRAGGAYVPLDAAYPAERLAFMLEDAGAPVLVTREALLGRLPVPEGTAVVCLDRGPVRGTDRDGGRGAAGAGAPALPADRGAADRAEDLAYVTYTSGSTGRPKGVMVPQRGVVRLVREADYARFGPDETFLHLAAVTFDLTTLEVWGPLLTGGRLVVFPAEAPTPDRLAEVLARQRVTFLWLTAGLFHQMAEARPEGLAPVRQLLAGGDALSAAHCRRVLAACPETLLIDGYGPTENTTFSSWHPMRRPEEVSDPVSIGRPIANSEAYVLDPGLEPLPVGAPGELLVGGDGLAWGYWRRPALTAERFVPHPFSDRLGDRLYHTGDLARWRADGTLEYLGRTDHQVKLRGIRIELGEVESALAGHPAVGEVVVVARELLGDKALIAYLAPRAGAAAPSPGELREHLAASLPEHMVPAAFVALAALPLSPNGKVDRRALPEPGPEHRASAGEHRAPRTPLEVEVAAVWAEVLGVPRVGLRDDFFALGGHSLLAGSILSRLAGALAVEVPIGALFRSRTLEAFAVEVAAARAAG